MKCEVGALSKIARFIADDLRATAPDRRVEFVIEEDVSANCDKFLIDIALNNLLGNAWKFTTNHPTPLIEFGTFRNAEDEQLYFVRDDRADYDMQYATHLFCPLQRLHSYDESQGTDIPLATLQLILQHH